MTEYAFINSQLLRVPLTRVMGLSSLVTKEVKTVQEQQLPDALTASAQELDTIIRKIADMLYQDHHFAREDVRSIIDKNLKATTRQVDTLQRPTAAVFVFYIGIGLVKVDDLHILGIPQ